MLLAYLYEEKYLLWISVGCLVVILSTSKLTVVPQSVFVITKVTRFVVLINKLDG